MALGIDNTAHSIDLHTHSTHSDGLLSPGELVAHAKKNGVTVLALTDHDTIGGLAEAQEAATAAGITLIPGIELSVQWRQVTLHVLGLNIDPSHSLLQTRLTQMSEGRTERAKRIAQSLALAGIADAYEGAYKYAGNPLLISRAHFARYLVEYGAAKAVKDVFKSYLTPGKPGYVAHVWPDLSAGISWLREAGGQAVLAHPGRYSITAPVMRQLLAEFKEAGGIGLEILTSNHSTQQAQEYAALAQRYGLLASCGSDYHGPGESWLELGSLTALPSHLKPIWQDW